MGLGFEPAAPARWWRRVSRGGEEERDREDGSWDAGEDKPPPTTTMPTTTATTMTTPRMTPRMTARERALIQGTAAEAAAAVSARDEAREDALLPADTPALVPSHVVPMSAAEEAFSFSWAPSGLLWAAGTSRGTVRVYGKTSTSSSSSASTSSWELRTTLDLGGFTPVTAIAFKPDLNNNHNNNNNNNNNNSSSSSNTRNILLAASAAGTVARFHATTGQKLAEVPVDNTSIHNSNNNHVYAVAYRESDGAVFATAGRDCAVRVYDDTANALTHVLRDGGGHGVEDHMNSMHDNDSHYPAAGHSNRVYALAFHPNHQHHLLSAGWDNTVQVWDLRVGRSMRSIFGARVCGDALAFSPDGTKVLTGSWRRQAGQTLACIIHTKLACTHTHTDTHMHICTHADARTHRYACTHTQHVDSQFRADALQVWDYASGSLIKSLLWPLAAKASEACQLYAADWCPPSSSSSAASSKLVAAGGSGSNEARVMRADTGEVVGRLEGLKKAVHSVKFSRDGRDLAVVSADAVHVVDVPRLGDTMRTRR
eukprot:jgi/Chlat1/3316/Chrsp22S03416